MKLTDELKDFVQIGMVVPDLEATKESMRTIFGLEPDSENEYHYQNCTYRNSDEPIVASALIACYNYFNIQLEFIQPIGEQDTVWSDYLKMGRKGLHHLRYDVDDHDAVTQMFAEKGVEIWMEGPSIMTPGARFTYYDTLDELGFVTEVVTRTK